MEAQEQAAFDVECPHCHKRFQGEVIQGQTDRHTGFKCPHCHLFVAFDRADGSAP